MIGIQFEVESSITRVFDYTGRPLRSWFLRTIQKHDPMLSKKLHDSQSIRGFVVKPLPYARGFSTSLVEGQEYTFGLRLLRKERFIDFLRKLLDYDELHLKLHDYLLPIRMMKYTIDDLPELMNKWANPIPLDEVDSIRISMKFKTPTQLTNFGMDALCMFPLPEKVFPSLMKIWQDLGNAGFGSSGQYTDWVQSNVYVSKHDTKTVPIQLSSSLTAIGFVGTVEYLIQNTGSPSCRLTTGLAKFSQFSNIGKHRTAGLGNVDVKVYLEWSGGKTEEWAPCSPAYGFD
jgi:CRISPR-associated endoribonuclease Cas6